MPSWQDAQPPPAGAGEGAGHLDEHEEVAGVVFKFGPLGGPDVFEGEGVELEDGSKLAQAIVVAQAVDVDPADGVAVVEAFAQDLEVFEGLSVGDFGPVFDELDVGGVGFVGVG